MKQLAAEGSRSGCRVYAGCAGMLNPLIDLAHEKRLTRQQYIMFALADMMSQLEVGASLAKKAASLLRANASEGEKYQIMSRLFAWDTAKCFSQNIPMILLGQENIGREDALAFLNRIEYDALVLGHEGVIQDMDRMADIIFGRA